MGGGEPFEEIRTGDVSAGAKQLSKKVENALSPRQLEVARDYALEIFASALQREAPEPTAVQTYSDVFDLTQVDHFIDYQQRMMRGEEASLEPIRRVFATILQVQAADQIVQGVIGYLYQLRRTNAVADDNLRGLLGSLMKASGDNDRVCIEAQDNNGRRWQAYMSPFHPDSIAIRRKPGDKNTKPKKRRRRGSPAKPSPGPELEADE